MDSYVDGLSAQISTTNNKAIKHLPIGIIVLDENDHIEWVNQFMMIIWKQMSFLNL